MVLGDGVEMLYKSPLSQVFIFLVLDELLGTQETRVSSVLQSPAAGME